MKFQQCPLNNTEKNMVPHETNEGFVLAMKLKNSFVASTKPKKVSNWFQKSKPFLGFVGNLRNLLKSFLDR